VGYLDVTGLHDWHAVPARDFNFAPQKEYFMSMKVSKMPRAFVYCNCSLFASQVYGEMAMKPI